MLQSINPDNWLGIKYNWDIKLPPYGRFVGTAKLLFDPVFVTPKNWLGFNRYWNVWAPSCEVTDSLSTLLRETARFYQALERAPRSLTKGNPLACENYAFYANHYNRLYYYKFWNSGEPLTLDEFLRDQGLKPEPSTIHWQIIGLGIFICFVLSAVACGPFPGFPGAGSYVYVYAE